MIFLAFGLRLFSYEFAPAAKLNHGQTLYETKNMSVTKTKWKNEIMRWGQLKWERIWCNFIWSVNVLITLYFFFCYFFVCLCKCGNVVQSLHRQFYARVIFFQALTRTPPNHFLFASFFRSVAHSASHHLSYTIRLFSRICVHVVVIMLCLSFNNRIIKLT